MCFHKKKTQRVHYPTIPVSLVCKPFEQILSSASLPTPILITSCYKPPYPSKPNGKLNLSNNRKWPKLHLFNQSNKLILLVFRSFSLKGIICGEPIFYRERVEPHSSAIMPGNLKGNNLRLPLEGSPRTPRFCNRKRIIIAYVSSIDFNHSIQNSRFLAYATPFGAVQISRIVPLWLLCFTVSDTLVPILFPMDRCRV